MEFDLLIQKAKAKAEEYIYTVLKAKGKDYPLCPPYTGDDNGDWEEVEDMPLIYWEDRYEKVQKYRIYGVGIRTISSTPDVLVFYGYCAANRDGTHGIDDSEKTFYAHEIDASNMAEIAEIIHSLETEDA